jgi:hypothetical protein
MFKFDNSYKYNSTVTNLKNTFFDRVLKKKVVVNADEFKKFALLAEADQLKYIKDLESGEKGVLKNIKSIKNGLNKPSESLTKSFEEMSKSIIDSQKNVEAKVKEVFSQFEKELADEAKKLNIVK